MINETDVENRIVALIAERESQYLALNPGREWFRGIEGAGMYDVDVANIREVVKDVPWCLVEYGGDSAVDFDNAGRISKLTATVWVYIFVRGLTSLSETSADAHSLARIVKDALRGKAEQYPDTWADFRYRAATPRARIEDAGMICKVLEFTFNAIDHSL